MSRIPSSLYRGAKKGIVLNGIEVRGLEKALRELGFKDAKKELARHVKPPLRELAREMSQQAPYAEDESDQPQRKRGKHLRGTRFPIVNKRSRGGRAVGWSIITPRRKQLGIGEWPTEKGYYPAHQELGPNPFMRPVWDRKKQWLPSTIAKSLAKWVDQVWRRGR